jgi:ComF family protein
MKTFTPTSSPIELGNTQAWEYQITLWTASMFFSALSQLVLKSTCPACGRTARGVFCESCQEQICAGKRSQALEPSNHQHPLPLFAWATYDNSLRRVITALKYDRQAAIGHWLGIQMAESWIQNGLHQQYPKLLVMPIPMHPSKQKLRGYNQAELISRSFAHQVGYRHQPQALRRHRETQAQYSVSVTDRDRNLQSAFSVDPHFKSQTPIVLVDDIYTTGATLRSAIQALQEHRLNLWGSAVAARPFFETQPNSPKSSPNLKKI